MLSRDDRRSSQPPRTVALGCNPNYAAHREASQLLADIQLPISKKLKQEETWNTADEQVKYRTHLKGTVLPATTTNYQRFN